MQFADVEMAEKMAKKLYPYASHIEVINRGYDNIVVLIDEQYALRFPRDARAFARGQYEKEVLLQLLSLNDVEVPRIFGESRDPAYLITSFIRGRHIGADEINSLTQESQKKIAEEIAAFAYDLHLKLQVETVRELRKKCKVDDVEEQSGEEWGIHVIKTLQNTTFPTSIQDGIAKRYLELWKSLPKTPEVAVHDDLHTDNILFENEMLTGVLDFADTTIGTPEQELRQLYRINEFILKCALNKYGQLAKSLLGIEASKIWAITQELSTYSAQLLRGGISHPSYIRSAGNLQRWFPEGHWTTPILNRV